MTHSEIVNRNDFILDTMGLKPIKGGVSKQTKYNNVLPMPYLKINLDRVTHFHRDEIIALINKELDLVESEYNETTDNALGLKK